MNESLPDDKHDYRFVGKVGNFCPMRPGAGGGVLLRGTEDKKTGKKGFAAATKSKGYRWLEAEYVHENGKEEDIDKSYYNKLVDDAVATISKYGDFEWFTDDLPF